MMNSQEKEKVKARLKRIVGQVAGIERMVEEGRYCVDVLLQISAARAALGQVSKVMLEAHIQSCVREAFERGAPDEQAAKIEEIIKIFEKNYNQ